ncbi:Phosphoglycerate dehydrogenase [Modicisalibacter ilicicola DSM 19980]|uniref:Phosphoglycerate dehydrogenase n=1 Tax=Modicisalibacter ilicicola DSM 19980 TaxID=1121942 RepID=A0A1M5BZX7_9GAMM|nr:D-2-hydroxyacid dehydrogenase [Halomonas ilicicola]SHF47995.1 Phosphoglycerate dehydrogenase [Halomonas ilicicola DSM 19980]
MIEFSSETKILFLQKPEILEKQRDQARNLIGKIFPENPLYFAGNPEDIVEGLEVDIIITPTLEWLPMALSKLEGYKWIHFLSAGVEKIWDMQFEKTGILLTKSSGVNSVPMSEYAMGAMLFFAKQFGRFIEQSQKKTWDREWLDELTGRTLLILGLGHVGQAVAEKANAFGMRVIGMQRRPRDIPGVEVIVPPERIRELLPEADYLVVSLPLTSNTTRFVDKDFLAAVKPGCVLIDMSRGGVVSESAIIEALDEKRLRGAALDVFEKQPLSEDSMLWARNDVLLTPHVSGTTPYYLQRALEIFIENVCELKASGNPLTTVNVSAGY